MKRLFLLPAFLLGMMLLIPAQASAALSFGIERPRIFSIQERPYRLDHEFELGVDILPLDAFYIGAAIGGSYTYHFSDFWAWEIASLNYSFNFDTPLEAELDERFGVKPVRGGGERIRIYGTTSLVVKPLFGKLSLFNSSIIYSETFFTFGVGPFVHASNNGENTFVDPTLSAGVGIRLWTSDAFSMRLEVRDYIIFKNVFGGNDLIRQEKGVVNTLVFNLSVALTTGGSASMKKSSTAEGGR